MFCVYCGGKIEQSAKFCPYCGKPLSTEPAPYSEQPSPPPREERDKPGTAPEPVKSGTSFLTKMGAVLIVLGLVCGIIGGVACSSMADSFKGYSAASGYRDSDGKLVITNSGIIGGNSKAVSYYNNLEVIMYVLGGAVVLMGIVVLCIGRTQDNVPIQERYGKIIDLDYFEAVIEFCDDGSRMRAVNQSKLILALDDEGVFQLKGRQIIGFRRSKC